jgi:hypothetical protein
MKGDMKHNGSNCSDPTAFAAMSSVIGEEKRKNLKRAKIRKNLFLKEMKELCDKHGFVVKDRLVIKDKETGYIFK